jgi:hypothetical protein
VLSHGQIVADGDAGRLRADRRLLVASYLGERTKAAAGEAESE